MVGLIRRKGSKAETASDEAAEPRRGEAPAGTAAAATPAELPPASEARAAPRRSAGFARVAALGMLLVAFLAWQPQLAPAVVGYGLIALVVFGVLRLFVALPRRSGRSRLPDAGDLPVDPMLALPEAPLHPSVAAPAEPVVPEPAVARQAETVAEAAPPLLLSASEAAPAKPEQEAHGATNVTPIRHHSKPRRTTPRRSQEEAVARLPVSLRQWMEARGATIPPERPAPRWGTAEAVGAASVGPAAAETGAPGVTFARMLSRRRAELKTGPDMAEPAEGAAGGRGPA